MLKYQEQRHESNFLKDPLVFHLPVYNPRLLPTIHHHLPQTARLVVQISLVLVHLLTKAPVSSITRYLGVNSRRIPRVEEEMMTADSKQDANVNVADRSAEIQLQMTS